MALTNKWTNKIDGVDDVLADDINSIAGAVIELENKEVEIPEIEVDQEYDSSSENPQSGKAVLQAVSPKADTNYVNNNFSNVLKGIAIDTNAVRIDDVSPMPHEIKVSLEIVNIINQDEFFASTNRYTLPTEAGKTYTFSYVPKEGVSSFQSISEIDKNENLYTYSFVDNSSTITIKDGCQYMWDFAVDSPSELYESVSMVLADVSDVKIKTYGKNLFSGKSTDWVSVNNRNYLYFDFPCDVVASKGKGEPPLILYKSNDKWETETSLGYITADGILIVKEEGYEYKLRASADTENNFKFIQMEVGIKPTEYEEYKDPMEGTVSMYPTTTLVADTRGVKITAEYNRDINKAFAELENAIANL